MTNLSSSSVSKRGNAAGAPRRKVLRGHGYRLAEYLDRHWDKRVPYTNIEAAEKLNLKASNMISMWRTGRTRVAIERLPDIAELMGIDMSILLPLWFEQSIGDNENSKAALARLKRVTASLERIYTLSEQPIINALRKEYADTENPDPSWTGEQVDAMVLCSLNESFAQKVLELAKQEGVALGKQKKVALPSGGEAED